jgi:hypothetical protein
MAQFGWEHSPKDIYNDVMTCVETLSQSLREDLTGVYLHGSLALNCFNPQRSNINLLVVIKQDITEPTLWDVIRLMIRHSGKPYPYMLAIVKESALFPWRYPVPFEFYYSEPIRMFYETMLTEGIQKRNTQATHHDLALHIACVRHHGICLAGQEVDYTFPVIPRLDYVDALMREVRSQYDNVMFDPVLAILTLCRAYYFLAEGKLASKDEAAVWVLKSLKADFYPVVSCLLDYYRGDADIIPFDPIDVAKCAAYLEARVSDLYARQEL